MNRRYKLILFIVVLVLALSLTLVACNDNNNEATITITTVVDGVEKVIEVTNETTLDIPIKEGYVFKGWFVDEQFTTEFVFCSFLSDVNKSNIKVYAKFVAEEVETKVTYTLVPKKEPTCTAEGNSEYYSGSDGKYYLKVGNKYIETSLADIKLNKISHKIVKVEAVKGTFKADGVKLHYKCTACNKIFTDKKGVNQTTLEELKINKLNGVLKQKVEPTCTENGSRSMWEYNGKYYEETDIKAQTPKELASFIIPKVALIEVPAVSPSFINAGNKKYFKCTKCNKIYLDAEGKSPTTIEDITIPKLNAKKVDNVPATCSQTGVREHWEYNGNWYEIDDITVQNPKNSLYFVINKLALVKVDEIPATYLQEGTKMFFVCAKCGKKYFDSLAKKEVTESNKHELIIPKLTLNYEITVAPTETSEGNLIINGNNVVLPIINKDNYDIIESTQTDTTDGVGKAVIIVKTLQLTISNEEIKKVVVSKNIAVSSEIFVPANTTRLYVNKIFTISGVGNVFIADIDYGQIKIGEKMQILHNGIIKDITINNIYINNKESLFANSKSGEVAVLYDLPEEDVSSGDIIFSTNTTLIKTNNVVASIYLLSKDEGGRHTPIQTNQKAEFIMGNYINDVTFVLPDSVQMIIPGTTQENVTINLDINAVLKIGDTFILRVGGKELGRGIITKIE